MNQTPFKKMILNPNLSKEMAEQMELFKSKFKLMFGITPYVSINTRGTYIGEISLKELFDIVNQLLDETSSKHYPNGIRNNSRLREIVIYRQAFCKIANSIGYKITSIANFLEKNHATVIHSIRNINNLLLVNDAEIMACMDEIYTRVECHIIQKENEETVRIHN